MGEGDLAEEGDGGVLRPEADARAEGEVPDVADDDALHRRVVLEEPLEVEGGVGGRLRSRAGVAVV